MLAVSDATLKVQTTDEGDPLVVSRSDAYRIPPEAHAFSRGDPAICNEQAARWVACRVLRIGEGELSATIPSGGDETFAPTKVLAPGPVTALNIQHLLEATEARRRFAELSRQAGDPVRPPGWSPAPHEPVIARNREGWFSAHVTRALEDGGVEVTWEAGEHPQALANEDVVPFPPFTHAFARGEFALLRGSTAGLAWQRVQVEAVGPEEAVIIGRDGETRRVSVRELVPLERKEPARH